MTLYGYYFAATGITEYAFFHGDRSVLCVSHDSLPNAPVRIRVPSGAVYTLSRADGWEGAMPAPGTSLPFLGSKENTACEKAMPEAFVVFRSPMRVTTWFSRLPLDKLDFV